MGSFVKDTIETPFSLIETLPMFKKGHEQCGPEHPIALMENSFQIRNVLMILAALQVPLYHVGPPPII
jgi:hypothetical protein